MNWLKNLFNPSPPDPESELVSHDILARIVERDEGFTVIVTERRSPVFDTAGELQAYLDARGSSLPDDVTMRETPAGAYTATDYELDRVTPQPTRERLLAYLTGLNYMTLARHLQDADFAAGDWRLIADGRELPAVLRSIRKPMDGGWS